MEEILLKNNKTKRKVYVNANVKIEQVPAEELEKFILVYAGIVEELTEKNEKRKKDVTKS
ncbi:MAG: hypothetical protein IJD50_02295 [Clostridia bacterium]|nr:hypothetical protein [Clostridia bacterium]